MGRGRIKASEHPPVTTASLLRLVTGVVLAAVLTWMVARAFQFG